ncbi:hypothetical protein F4679DRAFT_102404 [Xylaria curta]|nr:hypothetical protein F4679DRAFT_102404 [Xylaria curta]
MIGIEISVMVYFFTSLPPSRKPEHLEEKVQTALISNQLIFAASMHNTQSRSRSRRRKHLIGQLRLLGTATRLIALPLHERERGRRRVSTFRQSHVVAWLWDTQSKIRILLTTASGCRGLPRSARLLEKAPLHLGRSLRCYCTQVAGKLWSRCLRRTSMAVGYRPAWRVVGVGLEELPRDATIGKFACFVLMVPTWLLVLLHLLNTAVTICAR